VGSSSFLEAFYTSGSIDNFLVAGIKRVAVAADFHVISGIVEPTKYTAPQAQVAFVAKLYFG
jgi:hypothetical protein